MYNCEEYVIGGIHDKNPDIPDRASTGRVGLYCQDTGKKAE
jgi:hypothetical protein